MLRLASRVACASALLSIVIGASVLAQPIDKRTYFTFSGPVAMPGVTLPAGKYLFRIGDPTGGRKIVQVMSADGKKPIGLFFSIPAQRPDVSSDPEVRFMETPRNQPSAIRTWWYPGERTGYEFIYPKSQARMLAKTASQPVLTTQSQSTKAEETNTTELARVSGSGDETNLEQNAKPATVAGTSQRGEIADSESSSAAARTDRAELPRTASELPAIALTGSFALLAGFGMWLSRRQRLL